MYCGSRRLNFERSAAGRGCWRVAANSRVPIAESIRWWRLILLDDMIKCYNSVLCCSRLGFEIAVTNLACLCILL